MLICEWGQLVTLSKHSFAPVCKLVMWKDKISSLPHVQERRKSCGLKNTKSVLKVEKEIWSFFLQAKSKHEVESLTDKQVKQKTQGEQAFV